MYITQGKRETEARYSDVHRMLAISASKGGDNAAALKHATK